MMSIQDEAYTEAMNEIAKLRSIIIDLRADVSATQEYFPSERRAELLRRAEKSCEP